MVTEGFIVISGNVSNEHSSDLKAITALAEQRYSSYTTAHHEWINTINDLEYKNSIDTVRKSPAIINKIKEQFPSMDIKNVTEADEVYWAVSPKTATGSDRSLVDCHYDAPFGWFPTGGNIFYRVIIATNENDQVTTVFPNENKRVQMSTGDFHGLDYNKDWHCVEGKIPEGKYRILLKLHYLISPPGGNWATEFVRWSNVKWTVLSRETMRMSAKPTNSLETIVAWIVGFCRILFNHTYIVLIGLVFLIGFFQRKRLIRLTKRMRSRAG
jgi:hypothetical protein